MPFNMLRLHDGDPAVRRTNYGEEYFYKYEEKYHDNYVSNDVCSLRLRQCTGQS